MRFTTLASIGLIAVSTAALAQVAATPDEQKVPAAGSTPLGNDMAVPTNGTAAIGNDVAANATAPPANDMSPATPADEPKTTATPRRRR